jgi:hypothetical protein
VRLDFVGEEDLGHAIEVDEGLTAIRHFFSSAGGLIAAQSHSCDDCLLDGLSVHETSDS